MLGQSREVCSGLFALLFMICAGGVWQEECLFDDIPSGTKVSGSFQVSTGGFLDIDAKVL